MSDKVINKKEVANLPHDEIYQFYEGLDPQYYSELTGTNLNNAPKQLLENEKFLLEKINKIKEDVDAGIDPGQALTKTGNNEFTGSMTKVVDDSVLDNQSVAYMTKFTEVQADQNPTKNITAGTTSVDKNGLALYSNLGNVNKDGSRTISLNVHKLDGELAAKVELKSNADGTNTTFTIPSVNKDDKSNSAATMKAVHELTDNLKDQLTELDNKVDNSSKYDIIENKVADANELTEGVIYLQPSDESSGGGEVSYVVTPKITSPINNATNQSTEFTITGSAYRNILGDDPRKHRIFEVATNANFNSPVRTHNADVNSWKVDPRLDFNTTYYVRIKDVSNSGLESKWSTTTKITTSETVTINAPTVTVEGGPTEVLEDPAATGSNFSVSSDTESDTHEMTDWVLVKNSAPEVEVWSSKNDSTNKTTIKIPEGQLVVSTEYTIKVRYKGTKLGWSQYGTKSFTTATEFTKISIPVLNDGVPTTKVLSNFIVVGSDFSSKDPSVTHQSSDWYLYKKNNQKLAVWSKENSTDDLTIQNVIYDLEPDTEYVLKCKYRDNNNKTSSTAKWEFTSASEEELKPCYYFEVDGSINFGKLFYDQLTSYSSVIDQFKIYVNDELKSDWKINQDTERSLGSNARVKIIRDGDRKVVYPRLKSSSTSTSSGDKYLGDLTKILGPLPPISSDNNPENLLKDFTRYFPTNHDALNKFSEVCEDLFRYNPQITNLYAWMNQGMTTILFTSIPEKILYYVPNVTDINHFLYSFHKYTSEIPENLFKRSTKVTNIYCLFQGLGNNDNKVITIPENLFIHMKELTRTGYTLDQIYGLTSSSQIVVKFTARNITEADGFFDGREGSTCTVKVPRGSTTATTFKSASNAHVNVVEED